MTDSPDSGPGAEDPAPRSAAASKSARRSLAVMLGGVLLLGAAVIAFSWSAADESASPPSEATSSENESDLAIRAEGGGADPRTGADPQGADAGEEGEDADEPLPEEGEGDETYRADSTSDDGEEGLAAADEPGSGGAAGSGSADKGVGAGTTPQAETDDGGAVRAGSTKDQAQPETGGKALGTGSRTDTALDLLKQARVAAGEGDHRKAYELAAESNRLQTSQQAQELMVLSACKVGDKDKAKAAAKGLPFAKRRDLRTTCREHGVRL